MHWIISMLLEACWVSFKQIFSIWWKLVNIGHYMVADSKFHVLHEATVTYNWDMHFFYVAYFPHWMLLNQALFILPFQKFYETYIICLNLRILQVHTSKHPCTDLKIVEHFFFISISESETDFILKFVSILSLVYCSLTLKI